MRTRTLTIAVVLLSAVLAAAPQDAARTGSAKIWAGRHLAFEEYLRATPFERLEEVPIGVTKPLRGHFPPGGLAESAAWKVLPPGRPNGYWESYRSEIAAYELDKLLALDMVPPVVEKRWRGDRGAAVLWLAPVRAWKDVESQPKPDRWHIQVTRMKMFDNLIGNPDRNAGNLLVDHEWNLFLIDHSRAFISDAKLPVAMVRIDQGLWKRMAALDEATLQSRIGQWSDKSSVRAMLKRRDRMTVEVERISRTSSSVTIK